MRLILFLALLLSPLLSQGDAYAYKETKNHFVYFVKLADVGKAPQSTTGEKAYTYYKNGVISDTTRYVTDDRIQVAFAQPADLTVFEQKFSLKRIASLSPTVHIFENRSLLDDVELCSQLWEEEGIEYARPLFKNKKRPQ